MLWLFVSATLVLCIAAGLPEGGVVPTTPSKDSNAHPPNPPSPPAPQSFHDLHPIAGLSFDAFGTHVAASDNFVAVSSAPAKGPPKVYIYKKVEHEPLEGNATEESRFLPTSVLASMGGPHDAYGSSLALAGDSLLVGAESFDFVMKSTGAVYAYLLNDLNGFDMLPGHFQLLTPSFQHPNAHFGASLAVNDEILLVGAPGDHT